MADVSGEDGLPPGQGDPRNHRVLRVDRLALTNHAGVHLTRQSSGRGIEDGGGIRGQESRDPGRFLRCTRSEMNSSPEFEECRSRNPSLYALLLNCFGLRQGRGAAFHKVNQEARVKKNQRTPFRRRARERSLPSSTVLRTMAAWSLESRPASSVREGRPANRFRSSV